MSKTRSNPILQVEDLIDLEYFFLLDQSLDNQSVCQRDRAFYVKSGFQESADENSGIDTQSADKSIKDPNAIIRSWLDERRMAGRAENPDHVLPGMAFKDIYRLLKIFLLVFGASFGFGAAIGILTYSGSRPVNVSVFFGLFVASQMLLLLFIVFTYLLCRWRSRMTFPLSFLMLKKLFVYLLYKIGYKMEQHLSADRRDSFKSALGIFQKQQLTYGPIFYATFFILWQYFAISFNIGILAATLFKVVGQDLAFGWQSTIQFSAGAVYQGVQYVAWPWTWFISSPIAHPTLSQIEGSRMVLKDGMMQLTTSDLTAWWPFLCLSVVFYGLIPRLLLLFGGFFERMRSLKNVRPNRMECDRLLRRMRNPVLETESETEEFVSIEGNDSVLPAFAPSAPGNAPVVQAPQVVMIPEEIISRCELSEVKSVFLKKYQINIKRVEAFIGYFNDDKEIFQTLYGEQKDQSEIRFLIVQEAWQPPIDETIDFFKQIRADFNAALLQIILIGKPTKETVITPVDDMDWRIWRRMIDKLGDPLIYLEKIG